MLESEITEKMWLKKDIWRLINGLCCPGGEGSIPLEKMKKTGRPMAEDHQHGDVNLKDEDSAKE